MRLEFLMNIWRKAVNIKTIPKILIGIVFLDGILILIGWQFDITLLKSGYAGEAAVNPVSALFLILLGISAWILSEKREDKSIYWIAKMLAAVIFVIISIKASVIFGLGGLPIDQILFSQQIQATDPMNQISPVSTLCFILLSLGLLVIDFKGKLLPIPTHILINLCLAQVMLSMIGYLYGVTYMYQIAHASYYPIPQYSVVNLFLLCLSILLMRPRDGYVKLILERSAIGTSMRNLITVILFFSVTVGWARYYLMNRGLMSYPLIITLAVTIEFFITGIVIWWNTKALYATDVLRKNATERLRYQYDLMQSIISSMGDAIIVVDEKKKIVVANKASADLYGMDMKDMIGMSIDKEISAYKNGIEVPKDRIVQVAYHGEIKTIELRENIYIKNAVGRLFPIAGILSPLKGAENIKGFVFSFRDITKDKEIDVAKTEFVSLASHQLRTPLSTINWYAEMLVNGDAGILSEEQKEYLDEIMHANKRMIGLVNALLNVSQIELGVFEVIAKPVNVIKIARIVLAELEGSIKEKQLIIEEVYDNKMPFIMGDAHYMKIILQNLVTNAVKYSPVGGKIELHISKNDSELLIKVVDMGCGIPESARSRIFLKLFRADNIKAIDTSGNGLGLYLVKLIVDKSGGKIWFKSQENRGTTFYVTLPDVFTEKDQLPQKQKIAGK